MFRNAHRPKIMDDQQTKASFEYWRYCTMKIVHESAGIVHIKFTNQIITLKIKLNKRTLNVLNSPYHSHKTNSKVDLSVFGEKKVPDSVAVVMSGINPCTLSEKATTFPLRLVHLKLHILYPPVREHYR